MPPTTKSRRAPQGDTELMAKKQILSFKQALKLEQVDNEHSERPGSSDDSASRCESQAGCSEMTGFN